MNLLKEVVGELAGMFAGDLLLSLAVLAVVAMTAVIAWSGLDPLLGGAVLLAGSLGLLVESVRRGARR